MAPSDTESESKAQNCVGRDLMALGGAVTPKTSKYLQRC